MYGMDEAGRTQACASVRVDAGAGLVESGVPDCVPPGKKRRKIGGKKTEKRAFWRKTSGKRGILAKIILRIVWAWDENAVLAPYGLLGCKSLLDRILPRLLDPFFRGIALTSQVRGGVGGALRACARRKTGGLKRSRFGGIRRFGQGGNARGLGAGEAMGPAGSPGPATTAGRAVG